MMTFVPATYVLLTIVHVIYADDPKCDGDIQYEDNLKYDDNNRYDYL